MKRVLYIFLLVYSAASASADQINWLTSYDEAFERSKEENKNILIVITAPSWCSPCKYLEANVWPNPSVVEAVSNFVALRIEDIVDGRRNPLLNKFMFSGYPTTFIYNAKMEKLAEIVGAFDPEYIIKKLDKLSDPDFDIASTFPTLNFIDGLLKQTGISEWEIILGDMVLSLPEVSRDSYAYLLNEFDNYFLAVPIDDEDNHIYITFDSGTNWKVWKTISR